MKWPRGVHQGYARRNGLRPEDFNYLQWPVENVRLELPGLDDPSRLSLAYRCTFPKVPPLDNQYRLVEPGHGEHGKDREYVKLPDPVGLCLARVRFELRHCDTHDLLHVSTPLPTPDGEVFGGTSSDNPEFRGLRPGYEAWVWLTARPFFYYLGEDGGMKGQYAVGHRGYFAGETVEDPERHLLAVSDAHDTYGAILLDGELRPQRPDPEIDPDSLAEYNRLKAAEEAERKRLEREQEEEEERERIRQEEREARWAREDAEREAQRRKEEERAAAERKRNERYVQRDPVDPSKYEMLVEHLGIHFSWIRCPDSEKIGFLRKVVGMGGDWKAAAEQVAQENGWTL